MFLQIDPSNGLAIYDQVVRQMKFAVARGIWRTGDLVPSVRELSKQLAINPNTVARAYRQLQDDDVLEPVRGTGQQVAAGAPKRCRAERRQLVKERLTIALAEAAESGMNSEELTRLVLKQLDTERKKAKRTTSS